MMNQIQTRTILTSSSRRRKYTELWKTIKLNGSKPTHIKCERRDTVTVMNGVKKEKLQDKTKEKDKILDCDPTEIGVTFRLLEDTSINNI